MKRRRERENDVSSLRQTEEEELRRHQNAARRRDEDADELVYNRTLISPLTRPLLPIIFIGEREGETGGGRRGGETINIELLIQYLLFNV